MAKRSFMSSAIPKILQEASIPLAEKGIVFANVATREEVKDFLGLLRSGQKSVGVYRPATETMIGSLFFINSVYDERLKPPRVIWILRPCNVQNEKDGNLVRGVIEKIAPSIMIKIVSVI